MIAKIEGEQVESEVEEVAGDRGNALQRSLEILVAEDNHPESPIRSMCGSRCPSQGPFILRS